MRNLLLLAILLLFLAACSGNRDSFLNNIDWLELPEIPPPPGEPVQNGLANPFAGISNDMLIVAGGANFPDKPVYEGGLKVYHDDIFVYNISSESGWQDAGKLPRGIAYGVSLKWNNGLLCVGGKNDNGLSKSVILLTWDGDRVVISEYPELPFGLADMGGDIIDGVLYLAGGNTDKGASRSFIKIDLNVRNPEWEILDDFPGPARVQPVMIAQNAAEEKHLYLFSGSSHPENSKPQIMTDGLEFNPLTGEWSELGPIKADDYEYSLHGSGGIAVGVQHILFIGGVNKEIFYKALTRERELEESIEAGNSERAEELEKQKLDYFRMDAEDFKFNRDVLVYHTLTNTWVIADKYPYPGPAGASIVKAGGSWYVINGEIKPGVRSPRVYSGTINNDPSLGFINWAIIAIYLLGMLALGYYFMKREQGTDDFFKGGGRVPWWVAGVSIFATMLSAITFMSIPAKTYATNWLYFPMVFTILIMAWPVVKYYLPFFRRLNVTTAYEYLELRFSYPARALASFLFLIFMIARMALVLFLPSLALTAVTGIDIYVCIILMGIVTIIYCTMGGVEAVVWGDFIQGLVLFGGAIVAVIFIVSGTEGGVSEVIDITIEHEKMKTFDFAFDITRATFWVVVFGGLANNLISYSADQAVIQRYLTTSNEKQAAKGIWMNGVLSIVVSFIFYFIGTALFAYFKTNPSEMNMVMENPDSIFPHFIMARMPAGMAGILIAAIFSATMSTVSSNINSISTSFTADFYKKIFPERPDHINLRAARIAGIIAGIIGVSFALLMATWNILSLFDFFNMILGLLASGLAGLFVMGIFFKRINSLNAVSGFVIGTLVLFIIRGHTEIHFLLYGFIGLISSVSVALLLSIFSSNKSGIEGLTYKTLSKQSG